MSEYIIEPARMSDAPAIADAIIAAITPELCVELLGDDTHGIEDVHAMFEALAKREDSQYSYRNALVARSAQGRPIGVLVRYDGAELYRLRKAFVEEHRQHIGEID